MGVIDDLKGLSAAEEFFGYLDVAYDPKQLNVIRLHVLRRLQQLLAAEVAESKEDETAVRQRYQQQLSQAYHDLLDQGPLQRRLFKVHQDAVTPQAASSPATFVPLSTLQHPSK